MSIETKNVDQVDSENSNQMSISAGVKPQMVTLVPDAIGIKPRNINTKIYNPETKKNETNEILTLTSKFYLFLTSNNKYALLILYSLAFMTIVGNILFIFYLSQGWQESVLIITSIFAGFLLLLLLLNKSEAVIRLFVNIWRLWIEVDAREQILSELVDNKRDFAWALLSVAILIFLFTELITPHYLVNLLRILVGN